MVTFILFSNFIYKKKNEHYFCIKCEKLNKKEFKCTNVSIYTVF